MNKLDFSGRTAIVTGGMQGIGAAIVKRLKASGAEVVGLGSGRIAAGGCFGPRFDHNVH